MELVSSVLFWFGYEIDDYLIRPITQPTKESKSNAANSKAFKPFRARIRFRYFPGVSGANCKKAWHFFKVKFSWNQSAHTIWFQPSCCVFHQIINIWTHDDRHNSWSLLESLKSVHCFYYGVTDKLHWFYCDENDKLRCLYYDVTNKLFGLLLRWQRTTWNTWY